MVKLQALQNNISPSTIEKVVWLKKGRLWHNREIAFKMKAKGQDILVTTW